MLSITSLSSFFPSLSFVLVHRRRPADGVFEKSGSRQPARTPTRAACGRRRLRYGGTPPADTRLMLDESPSIFRMHESADFMDDSFIIPQSERIRLHAYDRTEDSAGAAVSLRFLLTVFHPCFSLRGDAPRPPPPSHHGSLSRLR